jgi:phytoene synthase
MALQLTNILRDLREDAQQGRVYLPLEDLRQHGYSVDELASGVANERFDRLMRFEIGRTEQYYGRGAQLMEQLEPDARRIFGMIMATYRALLEKIKRRPADVLRRRVSLGPVEKLRIAARWAFLPPRVTAIR